MRVNRKIKMSKMSCPLHAAAISACNNVERRMSEIMLVKICWSHTHGPV